MAFKGQIRNLSKDPFEGTLDVAVVDACNTTYRFLIECVKKYDRY